MDHEDRTAGEDQAPHRRALSLTEALEMGSASAVARRIHPDVTKPRVLPGGWRAYAAMNAERSRHAAGKAVDFRLPQDHRVGFLGLLRNSLRWW